LKEFTSAAKHMV